MHFFANLHLFCRKGCNFGHRKGGPTALILAAVFFICLLPTGCAQKGVDASLAFDLSNAPETLDPQIGNDRATRLVLANVMEGLTILNQKGEVELSRLTSSYTKSKDGKTYRFLLQKNLKWSDGSDLTGDDFVFAFQRIFTAATQSYAAATYSFLLNGSKALAGTVPVEQIGVSADKDGWITFRLTEDRPEFLRLLAEPAALPCQRAFFLEAKGRYGLERAKMLYNGPFRVQYWLEDEYLYLTRNSNYAGKAALPVSVALDIVPDESERFSRFAGGKTSLCAATKEQADTLKTGSYQTQQFADTVWCLAFSLKSGTLTDRDLRTALSLCYNRKTMASGLDEYHQVAEHLIPPAVTENRPSAHPVAYNPDKAANLYLAWLKKTGHDKLTGLTILVPESGRHRYLIGVLQQEWQMQLGLFVNLDLQKDDDYDQKVAAGDFQLALIPLVADYNSPQAVLEKFSSKSNANCIGFSSPGFDKALISAANADSAGKTAAFDSCYQILTNEMCVLPLYTQSSIYLTQKGVSGLSLTAFGDRILFADVTAK